MALSASGLKTRITDALTANGWDLSNEHCITNKLATAIADAVVAEIVANSELVPVSTDSGTAGAGIITGKVK